MAEQVLAPVPAATPRSAPLGPDDADRLFGYVFPVAIGAVAIQAALHLGNAVVLDNRISSFDADHEGNLIAWAGSSAIFAAACSAGLLALVRARDRLLLGLLAAAVAFLSLDETAALHERTTTTGAWSGLLSGSRSSPASSSGSGAWPSEPGRPPGRRSAPASRCSWSPSRPSSFGRRSRSAAVRSGVRRTLSPSAWKRASSSPAGCSSPPA
jgi:hypothetical protein